MTRRRPAQSTRRRSRHVARTNVRAKASLDPSITRLGFECYRLVTVRTGDGPPAILFAHLRDSGNAMSVFATRAA